jgi:hypothetical protein
MNCASWTSNSAKPISESRTVALQEIGDAASQEIGKPAEGKGPA